MIKYEYFNEQSSTWQCFYIPKYPNHQYKIKLESSTEFLYAILFTLMSTRNHNDVNDDDDDDDDYV